MSLGDIEDTHVVDRVDRFLKVPSIPSCIQLRECVIAACEGRLNELHPHSVKLILPYIRAFKGEVCASGSERVERSR